jgi:hypothetical protein
MMLDGMDFREIVSVVIFTFDVSWAEVALFSAVLNPMVSHIDSFRAFGLIGFVGDVDRA